jgi:hypothetical protein
MTFIEFRNAGEAPQRIRVCQRVEKEVFSRTGEGPSQRMPGVVVATGALMDATHDNQGSSLIYEEWEQLQSGPVPIGKLLALIGGDRTPLKTNDERPSLARTTGVELGWVVHSAERVYEVRVPEAGEVGIALFLGLQRFWPREWVLYPRGVKPFLQGQWTVALKSIQSKVSAAFRFDWRDSLKSRIEAYGRYPVVDLPPDNWEPDFLACLELPRGETFSPQQEMPVPFYNFCRFYGNEIRRWWSYGMHAHESLSTFVTALTDPELAQNHLRGHFVNQDPDGAFPYGVSMISRPGMRTFQAAAATAPWITWEAWNAYLWSGDRKFLDEAMERCEKSYRWWMEDRDRTGEGLCCWLDFGETVRDDGTVPTWRYPGAPVIYQEALDLNCYLLNLEWTLAEMAAEKGDSEKSVRYREAWVRRARAINGYMWHEADRCYYGTSEVSDVFVQVKDISTLMPLWAVAATADRAENLVRIFYDPKHFATSWPVPVLSVSNPQYLRDSMPHWHGGNWVEMTWLVARGLQNYGHYREAADLALRNVQMVFEEYERSGHLREYFHAETGRGLSLFDYIWAAMPASFITDVFFGIQPEREALAIVPSLPREWSRISIRNLHVRNKVLDIQVTRSKSATETLAKVNENSWPEIVEGRGIRIPWRVLEGDPKTGISIEIEQPLQIPENYGPRRNLPKDVLEPLPAHARISPTTEELAFREPILHYAPAAVPVMRPPMPWKAQH